MARAGGAQGQLFNVHTVLLAGNRDISIYLDTA
jgi:hypothetical protein